MKRLLLVVCIFALFAPVASGGKMVRRLSDMRQAVRYTTQIYSTALMPDSELNHHCRMALQRVSTELGGIEITLRFATVAGQRRYSLPDTVTKIVFAYIRTADNSVYSLKQWPPQAIDVFNLSKLNPEASPGDLPVTWQSWANLIELLPPPVRADTVVLHALVEHPFVSDTTGKDTVRVRQPFVDAAIFDAASRVMSAIERDDRAAVFQSKYEKSAVALLSVYNKGFDQFITRKEE